MFRGIAFALALATGVSGANGASHDARSQQRADNSAANPQGSTQPPSLVPIQNDLKSITGAIEAANNKQPTKAEEDRANRDLAAQEKIARWAPAVFWVALAELIITFVGVVVVWLTLIENRRTGQAQIRAYVSIDSATMEIDDTVEGQSNPVIGIVAKNTGQSPATNFLWTPTVQFIVGIDKRMERGLLRKRSDDPGTRIVSGQEIHQSELIGDMPLDQFAQRRPAVNRVFVRVRIEFEFTDVFGSKIKDEAYFSGLFMTIRTDEDGSLVLLGSGRDWRGELIAITKPANWDLTDKIE